MSEPVRAAPAAVPLRMWDNPELRRLAWAIGAATLLLSFLALLLWHQSVGAAHKQAIQRELSIIGQLASEHPELQEDVARAYARTATAEEYALGRAAAAKFGYGEELPLQLNRNMEALYREASFIVVGALLLLGCAALVAVTASFRGIYLKASLYAELAERIVEGDFRTELDRPAEGVFSKLAHQFHLMARRLESTYERLQAEKEGMKQLLSDISHQLKTPLAALQMFTELAQEENLDSGKRREFLIKAEDQITRMDWLIRQLLTVARLEAGAVRLSLSERPLLPTIQEAMAALQLKADQSGVQLVLHHEANAAKQPCMLEHDPSWLGEALGNIIKNGIEHTPQGGRVEVRLEETSVLLRVVIRDTGQGIPQEELPKIFRRFYKVSRQTPSGGSGIGLSLSKAIIEQHDGFIAVRSELGHGTTFTVTLPRRLTKS